MNRNKTSLNEQYASIVHPPIPSACSKLKGFLLVSFLLLTTCELHPAELCNASPAQASMQCNTKSSNAKLLAAFFKMTTAVLAKAKPLGDADTIQSTSAQILMNLFSNENESSRSYQRQLAGLANDLKTEQMTLSFLKNAILSTYDERSLSSQAFSEAVDDAANELTTFAVCVEESEHIFALIEWLPSNLKDIYSALAKARQKIAPALEIQYTAPHRNDHISRLGHRRAAIISQEYDEPTNESSYGERCAAQGKFLFAYEFLCNAYKEHYKRLNPETEPKNFALYKSKKNIELENTLEDLLDAINDYKHVLLAAITRKSEEIYSIALQFHLLENTSQLEQAFNNAVADMHELLEKMSYYKRLSQKYRQPQVQELTRPSVSKEQHVRDNLCSALRHGLETAQKGSDATVTVQGANIPFQKIAATLLQFQPDNNCDLAYLIRQSQCSAEKRVANYSTKWQDLERSLISCIESLDKETLIMVIDSLIDSGANEPL